MPILCSLCSKTSGYAMDIAKLFGNKASVIRYSFLSYFSICDLLLCF